MFNNLDVFRMAHSMAVHAGQRQALLSQNVANADTPGYIAKDLPDFASVHGADGVTGQRATRASHLHGLDAASVAQPISVRDHASPDGNTVSVEQQMLKATDTMRQHDRALAIYKFSLDVLRLNLGKQ